jgi:hypothetical protein
MIDKIINSNASISFMSTFINLHQIEDRINFEKKIYINRFVIDLM